MIGRELSRSVPPWRHPGRREFPTDRLDAGQNRVKQIRRPEAHRVVGG